MPVKPGRFLVEGRTGCTKLAHRSLKRLHSFAARLDTCNIQKSIGAVALKLQRGSSAPSRSFTASTTGFLSQLNSQKSKKKVQDRLGASAEHHSASVLLRSTGLLHSRVQNLIHKRTRCSTCKCSMAQAAESGADSLAEGLPHGFSDRGLEHFSIGIVGDLHLEPAQMPRFNAAAEQLSAALTEGGRSEGARLVQLGDLGGYDHRPGSAACFQSATQYLRQFAMPQALVTGNHDLEGDDFETDEDNLAAWTQAFRQRHFWSAELGPVLCVGMSTTRFRSNNHSAHEVHIDDEQIAWFKRMLQRAAGRPVVVFTHAPPLGCGLKAVEGVHVKNRCAWLNHSSNPEIFIQIVQAHPNIKLWFSGHYHLSQDYPDSIGVAGGTAFVQTGVIGECDRDGIHQSRVLRGDAEGYKLFTINHESGELRLDVSHSWQDPSPPQIAWLQSNGSNDTATGAGQGRSSSMQWPSALVFHQSCCASRTPNNPGECSSSGIDGNSDEWWGAGPNCVLRRMGGLVIEYDAALRAPIGAVFNSIGATEELVLVDGRGNEVRSRGSSSERPLEDGSSAVAVETRNSSGKVLRRVERNMQGGFFQIFQHNKWRAAKERKRMAQAA